MTDDNYREKLMGARVTAIRDFGKDEWIVTLASESGEELRATLKKQRGSDAVPVETLNPPKDDRGWRH